METQTRTSGAETATLGLGSVLVGSLPAALMTDEFREAAEGEQDGAVSVMALAESVTFRTSAARGSEPDQRSVAAEDRARIDDWTDEGGHGR